MKFTLRSKHKRKRKNMNDDIHEINNIRWWNEKIRGFDLLSHEERNNFITRYETYYIQCQKVLYQSEDPYHLTYKTLPTFLFFNYIDHDINTSEWIYKTHKVVVSHHIDSVIRCKLIVNGYLPALKWLFSNHIIDINSAVSSYLSSTCYYGHFDMAQYLFSLQPVDRNTYLECFRLASLGGNIHILEWLLDVKDKKDVDITPAIIDYFIKEVERRYGTNRKDVTDFLQNFYNERK